MRKLLIGCGVAVALVVAILIAGGMFAASWFRKQFPEADQLEKRRAELVEKYGRPSAYVPPLTGIPEAARLETFVALRESLVTRRAEAVVRLATFVRETKRGRPAERGFITKVVDAVGMTQGGASMLTGMLDYMGRRTRMQVDTGMGEGEYDYLYALTTFAYLQWDPLAATMDSIVGRDLREEIAGQRFEQLSLFEQQLGNLQRALEEKTPRTPGEEALLDALCAELPAAREQNVFPFAGKLPAPIASALVPYETRLRATLPHDPVGAFLDVLLIAEQHGGVRFRWDAAEKKRAGIKLE